MFPRYIHISVCVFGYETNLMCLKKTFAKHWSRIVGFLYKHKHDLKLKISLLEIIAKTPGILTPMGFVDKVARSLIEGCKETVAICTPINGRQIESVSTKRLRPALDSSERTHAEPWVRRYSYNYRKRTLITNVFIECKLN